jgi:LmbE family N-acetylglucosaminyl deacetylase
MERNHLNQPRVLLAVLAHPDDESFGMGGTLAHYARQGVAVHLVCATRGEVGEVEPHHIQGYASIGDLREDELRCAARKLGLAGVHFLGYRDSGMEGSEDNRHPEALAAAPVDEVAARVTACIRQLRPQVVVTFDPIGGYRHPDHIAIHRATVKAFHAAGNPAAYPGAEPPYQPEKLYFHTFPRGVLRWAVRLMPLFGQNPRRFGLNGDIDLLSLASENFPVHARVSYREVLKAREEAAACHASQGRISPVSGPLSLFFRFSTPKDNFMRAFPPAGPGLRERDLFEGVAGAASPRFSE